LFRFVVIGRRFRYDGWNFGAITVPMAHQI